jgi:hypothetical protein
MSVAQVIQRQGVNGFELGIIRAGHAEQLKAYTVSTLEAVIWLDIWQSIIPYTWEIML